MRAGGISYQKRAGHARNILQAAGKPHRNEAGNIKFDVLVVRRQHMWKVRVCNIIAGEHLATHHKPLVFVVHIQKRREDNTVGERSLNDGNAAVTQTLHTKRG